MRTGTRAAMHYLTIESQKIIDSIMRYEKIAIDEYEKAVLSRKSMINNTNEIIQKYLNETSIPASLEEGCPYTIIKKWPSVLSVFPLMENDWHWGKYKSWIYFYDRPKHIAQKYAAIMVFEDENEIECTLWSKGKILNEWKCYADKDIKFGEQNVLINDIYNGKMLCEWLQYAPNDYDSEYFMSLPLLFTSDYQNKWSLVKKTRLTCLYK